MERERGRETDRQAIVRGFEGKIAIAREGSKTRPLREVPPTQGARAGDPSPTHRRFGSVELGLGGTHRTPVGVF